MSLKRGFFTYNTAFFILILIVIGYVTYQFGFIKKSVAQFTCRQIRSKLQTAVESYRAGSLEKFTPLGRVYKPVNLLLLYKKGYLKNIETCPMGGEYRFCEDGTVYCTYHNREEERKY
jgi:hypothetical protein